MSSTVHHGLPDPRRAGEPLDLARVRLVASCLDADPPAGDFLTTGWGLVTCPKCLGRDRLGYYTQVIYTDVPLRYGFGT